jgi:hypothetical protein
VTRRHRNACRREEKGLRCQSFMIQESHPQKLWIILWMTFE